MTFSENGKLAEIQGGSRDLQHASVALFAEQYQYIFYFTLRASAAAAPRQFSGITRQQFLKVAFFCEHKTALVHYAISILPFCPKILLSFFCDHKDPHNQMGLDYYKRTGIVLIVVQILCEGHKNLKFQRELVLSELSHCFDVTYYKQACRMCQRYHAPRVLADHLSLSRPKGVDYVHQMILAHGCNKGHKGDSD